MPVSDLKFAQPARRNLLAPVLLAFLILGIVLALLLRFTPHRTADLTITRTTIYPTHTVFKSDSIIVANQHAEDALYVLTTLRIDDRLHLPLFLKDFTATLTTTEGWDHRRTAVLNIDLYHQGEQQVLIGRGNEVIPNAASTPAPASSPANN